MKKKLPYLISAVAVFIAVVTAVFLMSNRKCDSHTIELPPYTVEKVGETNNGYKTAEVTTDTLKTAISTIARPDGYHATYTVTTYWDGGESTSEYSLWQSGNETLISATSNGHTENTLIDGEDVYVWRKGYVKVFKSTLSDNSFEGRDRFARLLTYEELLSLPNESITDACYISKNSKPYVFVEFTSGILHYVNQLYVSAETGILHSAQIFDGETPIYNMEQTSLEIGDQPEDIFIHPAT